MTANQLVWWDDGAGNSGLLWHDDGAGTEGLTNDLDCCCEPTGCECADICAAPLGRVRFEGIDCDPGFAVCLPATNSPWEGTFTEAAVGTIPNPQPDCSGTVLRYWKWQPTIPCSVPTNPLIELVCCDAEGVDEKSVRINGQNWRDVTNDGEGDTNCQYWALASIGALEMDTDPSCCGTPYLEIWCPGADPGLDCGAVVDTGLG